MLFRNIPAELLDDSVLLVRTTFYSYFIRLFFSRETLYELNPIVSLFSVGWETSIVKTAT